MDLILDEPNVPKKNSSDHVQEKLCTFSKSCGILEMYRKPDLTNQVEHGLAIKKHWCKRKYCQCQSVTFRKDMSISATFQQASRYFVQSTSHTK